MVGDGKLVSMEMLLSKFFTIEPTRVLFSVFTEIIYKEKMNIGFAIIILQAVDVVLTMSEGAGQGYYFSSDIGMWSIIISRFSITISLKNIQIEMSNHC